MSLEVGVGAGILSLLGFMIGWKRPGWILPVLIPLVPWRIPFFGDFYPAIPFFLGALVGRSEAILTMLAEQRLFLMSRLNAVGDDSVGRVLLLAQQLSSSIVYFLVASLLLYDGGRILLRS